MTEVFFQYELENGVPLDITADVEPIVPAKLYGPPEDCYPEEGGEVVITECTIANTDIYFDPDDLYIRTRRKDTADIYNCLENLICDRAIEEADDDR